MKKRSVFYIVMLITGSLSLFSFSEMQPASASGAAGTSGDTAFVIQLRKNTNPKVIEAAKKPLLTKYPDRVLLTQVQPPNYILSIGYFSTEAEAAEFKKGLEKEYPGSTIVPVERKAPIEKKN